MPPTRAPVVPDADPPDRPLRRDTASSHSTTPDSIPDLERASRTLVPARAAGHNMTTDGILPLSNPPPALGEGSRTATGTGVSPRCGAVVWTERYLLRKKKIRTLPLYSVERGQGRSRRRGIRTPPVSPTSRPERKEPGPEGPGRQTGGLSTTGRRALRRTRRALRRPRARARARATPRPPPC